MIVYNLIDYTYVRHHYQHYLNVSQLAPTTVYDLQHYYSIAMMMTMSMDGSRCGYISSPWYVLFFLYSTFLYLQMKWIVYKYQ